MTVLRAGAMGAVRRGLLPVLPAPWFIYPFPGSGVRMGGATLPRFRLGVIARLVAWV